MNGSDLHELRKFYRKRSHRDRGRFRAAVSEEEWTEMDERADHLASLAMREPRFEHLPATDLYDGAVVYLTGE